MRYSEVLASKLRAPSPDPVPSRRLPGELFDWQEAVTRWALRKGRCALFEDCGLGKTIQELAWGNAVVRHTNMPVLLFSPLGAAIQSADEAVKFGIDARRVRTPGEMNGSRVYITNYERAELFDPAAFGGVILDESSILKNVAGKTRRLLTDACKSVRYRLSCTATPSPNDVTELANQAEFLGIMTRAAMLATFFVNDAKAESAASKWRLKKHAADSFYDWLATWCVYMRSPADIGYSADDYELPEHREILVEVDHDCALEGSLFKAQAKSLADLRAVRKASIQERLAAMPSAPYSGPRLTWCGLNSEADALREAYPGAVEVRGCDPADQKEEVLLAFARAEIGHLITKAKIAGHGMNWQCCSTQTFFWLGHSFESYYQASRRLYRFGQQRSVTTHIVVSDVAAHIWDIVQEKRDVAMSMAAHVIERMEKSMKNEIHGQAQATRFPSAKHTAGDGWSFTHGDSVDAIKNHATDSIGYQIMSPPFPDIYAYSDDVRDMGNATWNQFWQQMDFLIPEMLRVSMPGRLATFHCMDLPILKSQAGYVGLRDFPGEIIRRFEAAGWRYFARHMIWKDPVVENARTHSLGHGNLLKDSSKSRAGLPDYLVTFQKTGDNPEPIGHERSAFPVEQLQRWASPSWSERDLTPAELRDYQSPPEWMLAPIWYDIRQSDTLQKESARAEKDEKHICPLQLTAIKRCLTMWSAPGDTVASWFAGIGSEGFMAVKMGRKAVLCELKESYFAQGVRNLRAAEGFKDQMSLF